ncbi:hypothetical protein [Flavobacterium sp. UGB4466]|uniref:hypothetical protein n=1 Tax=Flavobacterium sp. UGB4466 TaxID=2730889 RepID=UPI00192A7263|nr:hypothetical protein [Flavobacterium sp. UGB4466]
MVDPKEWGEFRNSGLLLIINQLLHVFGWAIVFEFENDQVIKVYPARVKFRGFDNKSTSEAYVKVTNYLKENINQLDEEVKL